MTSDKKRILSKIADNLIRNKLVACANILTNVHSIYLWKKKIVRNKEFMMILKTMSDKEKKIYSIIKDLHNYQVPEIITLEINNIDENYAKWIDNSLYND